MTIATVGLLHPGAMGAAVGKLLTAGGRTVLWASEGRSAASATRAEQAGLRLSNAAGEETIVGVRASGPELFVDRRRSVAAATHEEYAGRHAGPLRWREGRITVRLIFDRSVVEVFANEGETVITDRVYPSSPLDRIEWIGGTPPEGARATMWELRSVWESR